MLWYFILCCDLANLNCVVPDHDLLGPYACCLPKDGVLEAEGDMKMRQVVMAKEDDQT